MTDRLAELRAAIGWTGPSREDVVEHRQAYRHAIGLDTVPDDEVPATFTACFLDEPPSPPPTAASYGDGWLNGGDRFEYHAPLRRLS
jgi:hypothetical protein